MQEYLNVTHFLFRRKLFESGVFSLVNFLTHIGFSVFILHCLTDASGPFGAELAALSIASHAGDNNGNFVMDPSAVEMIQRHASQPCGRFGKKFKFAGKIFKLSISNFKRVW